NFLYYPGKTIGDATLAYRNYFGLEKNIRQDFGDTMHFYSLGPVAKTAETKWLHPDGLNVSAITSSHIDHLPAILQSNVIAVFPPEMQDQLEKNWYGKSYEKGAVYVNVF